jgi:hypothetical protein
MTRTESNSRTERAALRISGATLAQVPGVIAISLYLVLLAVVIVIGVLSGSRYPPFYLFFSALLLTASGGLVLLFRWAWALALAAVFLLASYDLWVFTMQHEGTALLQGILNLIFFLYLVRTEVREKLR